MLPFGVEEGAEADRGAGELPVHLDRDSRAFMGEVWWHPAHADRLAELGAPAGARDAADRLALLHDLRALGRHDAVIHDEADEVAAHVALLHVLERPAADEVLLVPLGEPAHVRLEDVRLGVRVLADEDVHLLQAKDPLPLRPGWAEAEVGAVLEQRGEEVLTVRRREVDLVTQLADEADPKREAGNACDV